MLETLPPPLATEITYGPSATGPVGTGQWDCPRCLENSSDCPSIDDARSQAGQHAKTHIGMRAVYRKS